MENKSGLNLSNARTPEQVELMQKIIADGVCPFCKENFVKYHPKPILKETEFWFFTENMSPYPGTKHHFIFVYKPAHITEPRELPTQAITDLFDLINDAVDKYEIPGGSFFMRFGDNQYTGSSVEHLHAHLLMGNRDEPGHQSVKVKLG